MENNIIEEIINMLKTKPEVIKSNNFWPKESGLYSISGIKAHMKKLGYTNDQTDQALYQISNSKESLLGVANIWNKEYKKTYPYFYLGLDIEDINNLTKIYESI